jgi:hypothetical protein
MADTPDQSAPVKTLKEFYDLMADTAVIRRGLVQAALDGRVPDDDAVARLDQARASLEAIPREGDNHVLALDAEKYIRVDLTYEITEAIKDLIYLRQGEGALLERMQQANADFSSIVEDGVKRLENIAFTTFVTDRDGTTNNYCGRYRSSVQSVYNAVWLTRFARSRVGSPAFITSAPLAEGGIMDVSVNPAGSFIYGASKGRECIDLTGQRHSYPIDPDQAAKLAALNTELTKLLSLPEYEKFSLIGSGLQFKFGQTTVARQDIGASIPEDESLAFKNTIEVLVHELDPAEKAFRIEDTGLDLEIILTVGEGAAAKDFDKADGVLFMDAQLSMNLGQGPNLICGDTSSDVPMVQAAMEKSERTHTIFVTQNQELADRVVAICPEAVIVPSPDYLVAILNTLSTT